MQGDWLQRRQGVFGGSLSLSYSSPLEIVEGSGAYLVGRDGRRYLDCVNNVCHVGHCHPRVVAAGQEQMARLNTNTRYLYESLLEYTERLLALFPEELDTCFLVNSGSEANELALRLARTATGRQDMVVVDGAYHGHTSTLVDMSSYKHAGPGGKGAPDWVHVTPCPDTYRGKYREDDAAVRYVADVEEALQEATKRSGGAAAFLAEPLIGCGGQIVPPAGYLKEAFEKTREAGALCWADEIQIGFGRVGTHHWAFDEQGAVPDIVTLGKPIGNGHPMAAVVTTRAIAHAFDNGMEFFSTYGGNPVSCAIGLAVLDVLKEENLMDNARSVGAVFLEGFQDMALRCEAIGDVRGKGLYIGVELVQDKDKRTPDPALMQSVLDHGLKEGILLSSDGPDHNVLKIKPPMVMTEDEARRVLGVVEQALRGTLKRSNRGPRGPE